MTPIGYGIDVSHHNSPDWESLRGHVDFVMVRASYGTTLDERAKEHVARARDIGAKVGLYTFYRHGQSEADQFMALCRVMESCKIGTGDIVPALDIEDDEGGILVAPSWGPECQKFLASAFDEFGSGFVYITQRGWSMLGKPEWVLHCPLWVAHYRVGKPATPGGMSATIWQHRVDVFEPNGPSTSPDPEPPGALDQNRLLQPLPLIGYRPTKEDQERVAALVMETLRQGVHEPDTEPSPPPSTDDLEGHPV